MGNPHRSRLLFNSTHGQIENGPLTNFTNGPYGKWIENGPNSQQKTIFCDYCRKLGHLKDTCWRIHSKPDWKPWQNRTQSYQASIDQQKPQDNSSSEGTFNLEHGSTLHTAVSNMHNSGQSSTNLSSGSLAYKSNYLRGKLRNIPPNFTYLYKYTIKFLKCQSTIELI